MSKILIVRHGSTEYNITRQFCGITDIDMSPLGYQQIEKLRERLAKKKIDAIYCSDLNRTRITAEILAKGRDLKINAVPELREMNYGQCEKMTWEEIAKSYPDVTKDMIKRSIELTFPGGESFNDLAARINRFVLTLKNTPADQTVLVVGHSGPLAVLVCALLEFNLNAFWRMYIDNASLTIINTYPNFAILNLLNDVSHLGEGIK